MSSDISDSDAAAAAIALQPDQTRCQTKISPLPSPHRLIYPPSSHKVVPLRVFIVLDTPINISWPPIQCKKWVVIFDIPPFGCCDLHLTPGQSAAVKTPPHTIYSRINPNYTHIINKPSLFYPSTIELYRISPKFDCFSRLSIRPTFLLPKPGKRIPRNPLPQSA